MPRIPTAQVPKNLQSAEKILVNLTALNINATAGSRSAIDANLKRGHVVVLDPYFHLVPTATRSSIWTVTRAQTGFLNMPRFVVEDFDDSEVNAIDDPVGAPTVRRGGVIQVRHLEGPCMVLVPNGTAVGAELALGDGSYSPIANPGIDTLVKLRQPVVTALEANSSGAEKLCLCWFAGMRGGV
jgi:hypothetical protein